MAWGSSVVYEEARGGVVRKCMRSLQRRCCRRYGVARWRDVILRERRRALEARRREGGAKARAKRSELKS